MDIDLLSKMVGELILDNDEVTLPGVGTFVAEVMPSTFSDKGYTINPPYRRLSFRQRADLDTKLVEFYASSNGISESEASDILVHFLSEMKEVLKEKKTIVFPGLGRLRATKENNFFFVPDEDLDIYPDGFGLESVSLKSHTESGEEVSAAVASLHDYLEEADTAAQPRLVAEAPAVAETPAAAELQQAAEVQETADVPEAAEVRRKAPRVRKPLPKWVWIVLGVILLAALLLGAFLLLARFAPEFTDSLLYTREELEILNYPL